MSAELIRATQALDAVFIDQVGPRTGALEDVPKLDKLSHHSLSFLVLFPGKDYARFEFFGQRVYAGVLTTFAAFCLDPKIEIDALRHK
jgi:hypothetical protein